jgi:hypothetical protein
LAESGPSTFVLDLDVADHLSDTLADHVIDAACGR